MIEDDSPLRLKAAAEMAFPDGSISAKALRREAQKGNLVTERIAGKDYTTLKAIREMRQKCRVVRSEMQSINDDSERRRIAKASLLAKIGA